ncbi:hypothetical protein [Porphyrobacter sp. AAP82]|uniref:hypothetical protein n=1 Tax=Porphyrobacter sp. AAP82 TaxID=1248917 RepID=UPI000527F482|nr:hypothetical protein [Porphyrobacter sp. AAP82]
MGRRLHFVGDAFVTAVGVALAATAALGLVVYAVLQSNVLLAFFACGLFWIAFDWSRNAIVASKIAPWQRLSITEGLMSLAGEKRSLSDLKAIKYVVSYTKKRVNFIPSGTDVTGLLVLEFVDGSNWLLRSGVGILTMIDGNRGAEDTKMMVRVVFAISKSTGITAERISSEQFAAIVQND